MIFFGKESQSVFFLGVGVGGGGRRLFFYKLTKNPKNFFSVGGTGGGGGEGGMAEGKCTHMIKCFKWHFYSSMRTTVPNNSEIHALM